MACRARLRPEDVGLVSIGRRRVPGLRREEVAELAGITPAWYTQLETGCDIRVSPRMLDRVAQCLRLSGEEKVYLFSLALEELGVLVPALRPQSNEVLEAFTSMRTLSRDLWAATTEEETVAIAREHCARLIATDAMFSTVHTGPGRLTLQSIDGERPAVIRRAPEFNAHVAATWPAAARDELHLIGMLRRPGDVAVRSDVPMSPLLASHFANTLRTVRWPALEHQHVMAAVHSRNGFVGRLIAIYEKPQSFTKMDRAIMSAIADLTSLALA